MKQLDHALERRVMIVAEPRTVFRFFTDTARFANWWGQGSSIDPKVGGKVLIRYPNNVTASGEVLELVEDVRIVFSYGYDAPDNPVRPGSTRVTISIEGGTGGSWVTLRHELEDAKARDMHIQGWRHQLAIFTHVVTKDQHRDITRVVDEWFVAWSETNQTKRDWHLERAATVDVQFRDKYALVDGRIELSEHFANMQQHMPATVTRDGAPKRAQGTAVVSWIARNPSTQQVVGRGTTVFELSPAARVKRAIAIWDELKGGPVAGPQPTD